MRLRTLLCLRVYTDGVRRRLHTKHGAEMVAGYQSDGGRERNRERKRRRIKRAGEGARGRETEE